MQPMGRKPIRFPGKEDRHPGKGLINWWEDEAGENKKACRASARKEIAQGCDEYFGEKS